MKSATMRGTGLGAISYENDHSVEAPETEVVRYSCPQGHQSFIPFSIEAEVLPFTWLCRCGREAGAVSRVSKMTAVSTAEPRVQRTHWDMILERRTIADLEVLLKERLEVLRNALVEERRLSA